MQRAFRAAIVLAFLISVVPAHPVSAAVWTWTQRTSSGARNWYDVASSADGMKLAAVVYGGYIYTSADGGATWAERANPGSRNWRGIASSADGTRLVAVPDGGYVYTSTDSGATWVARTGSGSTFWQDVTSSADGTKLAAIAVLDSYNNCRLYTSSDGGSTWVSRLATGHSAYLRQLWMSTDGLSIVAPGTNGYYGGTSVVFVSTNGGSSWAARSVPASMQFFVSVPTALDDISRILTTAYSQSGQFGLFRSVDAGVSWTRIRDYLYGLASTPNGSTIAGTNAANDVYLSTDYGTTWVQHTVGTGLSLRSLAVSSNGRRIVTSSSGGYIWTGTSNSAPTTPSLGGPTSGVINTSYTFNMTATDPEDDTIRYAIDWNNDDTIDEYVPASGYVSSGTQGQATHSFTTAGTYAWKARTEDSQGTASAWASYTTAIGNPAPVVLLTASSNTYHDGIDGPVTLSWSSSYATSCTGTGFSTSGATSGTTAVTPTETTTYTAMCTGSGGTTEASQTITYVPRTCTVSYACTAGGNTITRTNADCSTDDLDTCTTPAFCSAGVSTCSYPPMSVAPFGSSSGHLQVRPSLVRVGGIARLFWNVENAQSCTVSSDTSADTWTFTSSGVSGQQTAPILSRTTYTIVCTAHPGGTPASLTEHATVSTLPVFLEL